MSDIKAVSGQSVYDLCLMTYGSLDKLHQFIQENQIDGTNTGSLAQKSLTFDSGQVADLSLYDHITNNKVTFCTDSEAGGGVQYTRLIDSGPPYYNTWKDTGPPYSNT